MLVLLAGVDIGLIAWATRSLAQEGPSVKIMFAAEVSFAFNEVARKAILGLICLGRSPSHSILS